MRPSGAAQGAQPQALQLFLPEWQAEQGAPHEQECLQRRFGRAQVGTLQGQGATSCRAGAKANAVLSKECCKKSRRKGKSLESSDDCLDGPEVGSTWPYIVRSLCVWRKLSRSLSDHELLAEIWLRLEREIVRYILQEAHCVLRVLRFSGLHADFECERAEMEVQVANVGSAIRGLPLEGGLQHSRKDADTLIQESFEIVESK